MDITPDHIFKLYRMMPSGEGKLPHRVVSARFVIKDNQLTILEDHFHDLRARVRPGPLSEDSLARLDHLANSSYFDLVSEGDLSRGARPDAIEEIEVPQPKANGSLDQVQPRPPPVFQYLRVGMAKPVLVEFANGKPVLNGSVMEEAEARKILENVRTGLAVLRYHRGQPMQKAELSDQDIDAVHPLGGMKPEQSTSPYMGSFQTSHGSYRVRPGFNGRVSVWYRPEEALDDDLIENPDASEPGAPMTFRTLEHAMPHIQAHHREIVRQRFQDQLTSRDRDWGPAHDLSPEEKEMALSEKPLAKAPSSEDLELMNLARDAARAGIRPKTFVQTMGRRLFTSQKAPGLGNFAAYQDFLSRPRQGVHISLDLNDFGNINKDKALGYKKGDEAIKAASQAIRTAMDRTVGSKNGKTFHLSGDEFWAHVPSHEHAQEFARVLKEELARLVPLQGQTASYKASVSMGFGHDADTAAMALLHAKDAKKAGKYALGQAESHAHSLVPGSEGPVKLERPTSPVMAFPPPPEVKAPAPAAPSAPVTSEPAPLQVPKAS